MRAGLTNGRVLRNRRPTRQGRMLRVRRVGIRERASRCERGMTERNGAGQRRAEAAIGGQLERTTVSVA
jgi:hypothetical protein